MLQQADIVRHPVAALGQGAQGIQNPGIRFAGIGLTADGEAFGKAEGTGNAAVHFINLRFISLEQVHEACFGTGGSAAAQEAEMINHEINLFQIRGQVLQPQGSTLAHGHRLCRLVVGIAKGWHILILLREIAQALHGAQQFPAQVLQAVPIDHQVSVIGHIAAGGSQMDNARRGRCNLSVGIHMSHDIVADFLLPLTHAIVINVLDMGGQFIHLSLCHRQAEFHFRFCQGNPEASPGAVPGIGGKQLQHIFGSIPGGQGRFILLCHDLLSYNDQ